MHEETREKLKSAEEKLRDAIVGLLDAMILELDGVTNEEIEEYFQKRGYNGKAILFFREAFMTSIFEKLKGYEKK